MFEAAADNIDWVVAGDALSTSGWHRLASVLSPEVQHELADVPSQWHPLPPEEGSVRQDGFGSYLSLDDAAQVVRQFAQEITESITTANPELQPVPKFNEVTWTRYPVAMGFITKHRDPPGVGGVIAIATLTGRATFRVWADSEPVSWKTAPGDVVLLRGYGWPRPGALCPVHEVEPPAGQDRMIMTFRHNRGGPGAAYF